GLFFLLMLELQNALGYDPFAAGLSLLPMNAIMLTLSPLAGRLAQRVGPRLPMTAGCLTASVGLLLFRRVQPGASYATVVLPALLVFALGMASLVAPLTAAVLGAVETRLAGVASAVNNAVARLAGLLATAVLPAAAGLGGAGSLAGPRLAAAFPRAMTIGAALCAAGGVVAWLTVRDARPAGSPEATPPGATGSRQATRRS
ncbi:MAG: MFS transporter, partial [Gemmatirosa sp.]|nr:MFS transporter [Gemmatirosa sp.]